MAEVATIAVIGAGIMGRGIAHAAALGGYRTILEDFLPNALRKAETEIRANLDKAVELGKVTAPDADAAFRRAGICRFGRRGRARSRSRDRSRSRRDGIEDRNLHPARQNLPSHHDSRFQHFVAQRHRDRQRHLPRQEMRRHALFQSGAQDEAARSCARAGNRRRHPGRRRRSRQAHGQRSCGDQRSRPALSPAASTP